MSGLGRKSGGKGRGTRKERTGRAMLLALVSAILVYDRGRTLNALTIDGIELVVNKRH